MENHPRRAVIAAGILLTAAVCATVPASAAPLRGAAQATAVQQTPATALVVNARTGGHCTYDRLVIDVKGTLPPVTVKRVSELRYDANGQKVPLSGKYFLEIRLSPAAAHNEAGQSVYQGPRLTKVHLPKLKGLALTGDFEGVVTFGTAFTTKPAYSTQRLHSPERFVLDIKHANSCG